MKGNLGICTYLILYIQSHLIAYLCRRKFDIDSFIRVPIQELSTIVIPHLQRTKWKTFNK
jgi:hypothetical protein